MDISKLVVPVGQETNKVVVKTNIYNSGKELLATTTAEWSLRRKK